MSLVKAYGNAPLESGSRNAEIFKTGLYEVVYKFDSSCLGAEIIGLKEKLLYPVCKRRHLEEVSLLFSHCYGTVTFGTAAVLVKL